MGVTKRTSVSRMIQPRERVGEESRRAPHEETSVPNHGPLLRWELATFRVLVGERLDGSDLHEIEVRGLVSGPFGIFRGNDHGPAPEGRSFFSLIHLPTARTILTLNYRRQCMAMAAELLPLRVPWSETDAEKVLEGAPDHPKVQEIYARYSAMWR